jgi:hypothetical protein
MKFTDMSIPSDGIGQFLNNQYISGTVTGHKIKMIVTGLVGFSGLFNKSFVHQKLT